MEIIFTKIFNISVTASMLIIAVILLRLILKNAPKWTRYILWLLVALRLVIPFTFESPFSLVPNAQAINSTSNSSTITVTNSSTQTFNLQVTCNGTIYNVLNS